MSDDARTETLSCWPGGWPGQQVVELDNLGDPGIWLEERLAEIEVALGGDDAELENTAALLTHDYIAAAARISFPIPSDFGVDEDVCRDKIQSEFRGFLLEWRRIIETASNK